MSSDLSVAPLRTASLSAAVATPLEKQNGADLTPDALAQGRRTHQDDAGYNDIVVGWRSHDGLTKA